MRRFGVQQRLHADLGSEEGLDLVLGTGLCEAYRPVEAVVVGEGQGRLAQGRRPGDQLLDPAAAVEEREVRVHVQVDEGRGVGGGGGCGAGRGRAHVYARGRRGADGCHWPWLGAVPADVVVCRRYPLHRE